MSPTSLGGGKQTTTAGEHISQCGRIQVEKPLGEYVPCENDQRSKTMVAGELLTLTASLRREASPLGKR